MAWELVRSRDSTPPWVQWIDRPNAEGWIAVLRRLLDAPPPTEAGAVGAVVEEARRQIVAFWRAIGAVAAACDLPSHIFAPYAQTRLILGNRFESGEGFGRTLPSLPPGELYAELWAAMRGKDSAGYRRVAGGDPFAPSLVWRVDLRRDGSLWAEHLAAIDPPGSGTAENACVGRGAPIGGGLSSWDCWTWREDLPSAISADRTVRVVGLPPLRVFLSAAHEIASRIVAAGVDGVVTESRAYALTKNLLTARAIGVELPEDIALFAARAEEARRSAPFSVNTLAALGAGIGPVVGVLATNPVLGALVGAGLGLGQVLFTIFGQAQGYDVDAFSRREPVLETTWISGQLSPPLAPSQVLEVPPTVGGGTLFLPGQGALLGEWNVREARRSESPSAPPAASGAKGKLAVGALLTWLLFRA